MAKVYKKAHLNREVHCGRLPKKGGILPQIVEHTCRMSPGTFRSFNGPLGHKVGAKMSHLIEEVLRNKRHPEQVPVAYNEAR